MHPTQTFHTRRDGRTVLTMTVRGTDELKYWILGFGPHVEVLRPAALRAEVGGLLAGAARAYAGGDTATPPTPRAKPRAAGYGAAAVRAQPRKQGRN